MIFIIDKSVHDLEIIYADNGIHFVFVDGNKHISIIKYWSIAHGHQHYIQNYQNGLKHGTQCGWYNIRGGGHLSYIENYQNGYPHGPQCSWRI
jgi:antitoxin component YwqK of YwqJK toxin-antitoxin module